MAKTKKDKLLASWRAAQKALAIAKAEESDLRSQVVSLFADKKQREGTQSITTSLGVLAVTKRLKYTLQNKLGETRLVADKLPEDVANSLLSWSPRLDLAEYRKLKDLADSEKRNGKYSKALKQIETVITVSDGSAQVKMK